MRRRMCIVKAVVLALLLFIVGVSEGQVTKTVAVFSFKVNSPQGQLDYLSEGLADMLIAKLAAAKRVSIVDESRLSDALGEAGLAGPVAIDERLAVRLGKAVGADSVILGTLTSFGATISLDIRVVAVDSGNVQGAASERVKDLDGLGDVLDRLSGHIVSLLLCYRVSGKVTNAEDGRAIAGATVSFTGALESVTTGTEAEWVKDGLMERTVVTVSKDGWAFAPPTRTVAGPATDVDFAGTPVVYTTSGKVTDPSGAGASGITLTFSGGYGLAVTAADGSYTKAGLQGTVTVTPMKEGWSFMPPTHQVKDVCDNVSFIGTPPPYIASGRVTSESGAGLEGVKVVISGAIGREITTDAHGMWAAKDLVGAVTVAAAKEAWVFVPTSRQVTGPSGDVSFAGKCPSYSVSGRLVDQSGDPISQVTLTLTGEMISRTGGYDVAIANPDGYWGKAGLQGVVTVTPTKERWAFEPQSRVVTGPSRSVNFVASPRGRGRIAFHSYRDAQYDIYTINPDGSGETRLTYSGAQDRSAAWSRDGTKIAFQSDRQGDYDLFVMAADGSDPRRLTGPKGADASPAWSPDGSKIAFESDRDGDMDVFVVDVANGAVTRLTSSASYDRSPSWSPDGTKIAFESARDGNYEIYTMNADGSAQTRVTRNGYHDYCPSWSPDGSKMAFVSERDGNREIYVMKADGTGQTRLTSNGVTDDSPCWSPDGSKIAFESVRDGNYEIYVMNSDGTAQIRITRNTSYDREPSW